MAWDVLSGAAKMAWDVLSGVTKTAWDVLSGVANQCVMFCPGCQKMAWDVLSRDVVSYIPCGQVSTSSQSLRFIVSLRLYSSFITSRPGPFRQNVKFGETANFSFKSVLKKSFVSDSSSD